MTTILAENNPKRRDKLVIIAEIIDIARKGSSKTHIMYKANLSFTQLNQYLELLTQTRLLEKVVCDGKDIYKASQKGIDFMERQCDIISFLNVDSHQNSVKTSFNLNFYQRSKLFI